MLGLARSVLVGSALALATPALAQRLGTGGGPDISIVRVVAALILCLFAALALALVLSKRGIGGAKLPGFLGELRNRGRVRVIESRRISVHADLCLVSFEDEELLILCGPGGAEVLSRRPSDGSSQDRATDPDS